MPLQGCLWNRVWLWNAWNFFPIHNLLESYFQLGVVVLLNGAKQTIPLQSFLSRPSSTAIRCRFFFPSSVFELMQEAWSPAGAGSTAPALTTAASLRIGLHSWRRLLLWGGRAASGWGTESWDWAAIPGSAADLLCKHRHNFTFLWLGLHSRYSKSYMRS